MSAQKLNKDPVRRPKMESPVASLDQVRVHVQSSDRPTLKQLLAKFSGWDAPEVSGRVKTPVA